MLSNLTVFRAGGEMPTLASLREAMAAAPFVPCGPTQPNTWGWVPPRGEHAEIVEAIGGQWIAALKLESKMLPSPVVKRKVEEMAAKIEEQTGRKPKGRVLKDLKDEAILSLLPQAFTKQTTVLVWIDPRAQLVVIDTGSSTRADAVALALIEAAGRMNLTPLQTELSPTTAMAMWLREGEGPADFSIDRTCELKGIDGEKAAVRYARHPLDIEEVRAHIEQGKLPTLLAMTYRGRVSFVLHDDLTLKAVEVLDFALEQAAANTEEAAAAFDADVAIGTGELAPLLAAVVEALGGVKELPIEAEANATPETAAPAPENHHGDADTDPLYAQSVAIVRENRRASISLVQRHLRIGYNRAARLLERMEAEGLVTPMNSQGARSLQTETTTEGT